MFAWKEFWLGVGALIVVEFVILFFAWFFSAPERQHRAIKSEMRRQGIRASKGIYDKVYDDTRRRMLDERKLPLDRKD